MYGKGNIVKWNYSSYRNPTDTTTSAQISTYAITAEDYSAAYTYQYDDNGNILSVSDGTNTTSYVYDSENQLLRENNQAANKTWTWEYDNAGNILNRKEYAYTTEALENITPTATFAYTYGDESWGDLLTGYADQTITSDAIGNMLSDGTWTYTWKHGRELSGMTDGSVTWSFTYNADDLRTRRTDGTTTYDYTYNGSTLTQMRVGSDVLHFVYDASGVPMSVTYNGTTYYYVTNLQGDVIAILDAEGTAVVTYTYDAWGKILATTGSMASSLGIHNPLRYRGYVYDQETQLYYLQSRYYDPDIGRFINADAFASTGQGFVGNNMFTYCGNNPILNYDSTGEFFFTALGAFTGFVSGGLSAMIMGQEKETWFETACHGAVGGAIAGAGIDAALLLLGSCGTATPVVVGAFAIAYAFGGAGNLYTTYATSNGTSTGTQLLGSFIIGGTFNTLSLATALTYITPSVDDLIIMGTNDFNENFAVGTAIGTATGIATTMGISTPSKPTQSITQSQASNNSPNFNRKVSTKVIAIRPNTKNIVMEMY